MYIIRLHLCTYLPFRYHFASCLFVRPFCVHPRCLLAPPTNPFSFLFYTVLCCRLCRRNQSQRSKARQLDPTFVFISRIYAVLLFSMYVVVCRLRSTALSWRLINHGLINYSVASWRSIGHDRTTASLHLLVFMPTNITPPAPTVHFHSACLAMFVSIVVYSSRPLHPPSLPNTKHFRLHNNPNTNMHILLIRVIVSPLPFRCLVNAAPLHSDLRYLVIFLLFNAL